MAQSSGVSFSKKKKKKYYIFKKFIFHSLCLPGGHVHMNVFILVVLHVALFKHGLLWHASILVSQFRPGVNQHLKKKKRFVLVSEI